jgi:putative hemolysin
VLTELSLILALVLLNGVFSAAEIAVISLRGSRLDALVEAGSGRARAVKRLRADPERFLATVQIGVTVVGAVASAFGGATIAARLHQLLLRFPSLAPHAESISLTVVVALVSYLSLVLGELIPKSLALRHGEPYALLVAGPLLGLSFFARPAVWLLTASSNLVLRFFGDSTTFTEARLSTEELQQLVEEAADAGSVDAHAGQIASRAFDFAGLTVEKVMIPRSRVVALPRTATLEEVRETVAKKGHTRMPVYEGSFDAVVGYLNVKDLISAEVEDRPLASGKLVRPSFRVPETMPAVELLDQMKRRRVQFAVVVDDLGVTSGIVTLEDLVEEIVGDVFSEHEADPSPSIREEGDGSFLVHGEAAVHEVSRHLDVDLPAGEGYSTVAGLAIKLAGKIPEAGQRLETKDGVMIEVVDATARQVKLLRVIVLGGRAIKAGGPGRS